MQLPRLGRAKMYAIIGILAISTIAATGYARADDATITLVVDYADGVEKRFTKIQWAKDMTVLDAMSQAKKHPRGIDFKFKGKGATAFLTQIDNLKNEGKGSNWIYRVNDKLGDRSFAIHVLKESDTVLWKFGKYR